jgi:hypothetical protein
MGFRPRPAYERLPRLVDGRTAPPRCRACRGPAAVLWRHAAGRARLRGSTPGRSFVMRAFGCQRSTDALIAQAFRAVLAQIGDAQAWRPARPRSSRRGLLASLNLLFRARLRPARRNRIAPVDDGPRAVSWAELDRLCPDRGLLGAGLCHHDIPMPTAAACSGWSGAGREMAAGSLRGGTQIGHQPSSTRRVAGGCSPCLHGDGLAAVYAALSESHTRAASLTRPSDRASAART